MKSRILGRSHTRTWLLLTAACVTIGHGMFSILAWQGDRLALALLIAFLFFWTALAIANSLGWKSSLQTSSRSLDGWKLANEMQRDMAFLLTETLRELALHDPEKSSDILDRANTIVAMRGQMLEERMERNDR